MDWLEVGNEFQTIHEPARKIIKAIIQAKN
jgi:hypothetical protein